MNPFFHTDFSISDSLKTVRISLLIYESIIVFIEPFKFTNDADGFQSLLLKLESFDSDNLIIDFESTAHYGDNLVRYLVASKFRESVLDPIATSSMRKT